MSEKSLLPCPFCKTELEIIGKGHYFAHKTNNGCILQHLCFEIDDEEAVKAWNTRKPMEAVVAELEKILGDTNFEKATKEVNESFYDGLAYAYGMAISIVRGKE